MNGNMMGNMNPMQQMMWNMMQNGMGGQQMRGGMDCDEFEDCLEKYCREVSNGRREFPRAFKSLVKKAWRGAKEAVSGGRYGYGDEDDDDDEDEDKYADVRNGRRYSGRSNGRRGKGFWDKMEMLHAHKSNVPMLNMEMSKLFPNATPEQQALIRKMATEYSEDTRKHLTKLMQDDED